MFFLSVLLGSYSYFVFSLGLLKLLYPTYLICSCIGLGVVILTRIYLIRQKIHQDLEDVKKLTLFQFTIITFLLVQILVNLVGALGPELGFDALWYHLTIPKIFLQENSIFFIKGNLFYYSLLPKLTEMLYIIPLSFWDERGAKLIHFFFGVLTLIVLYKFSRLFLDKTKSLLVLLVYYSNLVVGWESTSSYVDLSRTFYEILSVYFLFLFFKKGNERILFKSGLSLGFAICVKLLSLGSVFISLLLILISQSKSKFRQSLLFTTITLLIPLPWLIYAFFQSGNALYPIFSGYSDYGTGYLSPLQIIRDAVTLFIKSPDPLTPLYVIFLPLVIIHLKKYKKTEKFLLIYSLLSIVLWCLTPRTGESRFFAPYLPVLSVAVLLPLKYLKDKILVKSCVVLVFVSLSISIVYRGAANLKYVPVLLGKETKQEFLLKYLNFSYGDFIDENSKIKTIVKNKTVLLYGLHNLYYIDFPFIDSSYINRGDTFFYVLTQNVSLPTRFKNAQMVYSNSKTFVKLYKVNTNSW